MLEGTRLRNKLRAGDACLGTWINFTDPTLAELLAGSGYDFFIIDAEHAALDIESIQSLVMATKGTDVVAVVRVPWNDPVHIKRVLDAGAGGILVPNVRTLQDVEDAVSACLYPPEGIRGYGPRRPAGYDRHGADYLKTANDGIVIWAQIEHVDAVGIIDRIVEVPRLDGVFLGANDLSGSMGILGQTGSARVQDSILRVIAAARAAGKPAGIGTPPRPEAALAWLGKGMQFLTLGSDQDYLVAMSHLMVSSVRGANRDGGR